MVVGTGRGPRPAGHHRLARRHVGRRVATRPWPRCAPPSSSPTTSATRLAAALGKATGKQVEVKVVVDPTVLGGIVAHRRRHRHRRLASAPSRATASTHSEVRGTSTDMTDLSINPGDITAALAQEPRGLPRRRRASARSAASSRSATASPASSGLPDAAVNELLEFEDGTLGLALNLDEESIGAVVLGDGRPHRGGPAGQGDRPHPLGARRRRPARPGRQRPRRAHRRQGRHHRRRAPPHGDPGARASPAASRCTSRCRPASRPSTP